MYGFLITTGEIPKDIPLDNPRRLTANGVHFYYSPMPKFENDKLFYTDEEKTVLLDGVIFNKQELMDAKGCGSWRETVDYLIREEPEIFQKELRGSFCGAVRYGAVLEIFTNQTGEKTVYYTQRDGLFAAASHNNILTAYLKEQGVPVEPDTRACRELLCTGALLHGSTPFQNIRRLNAGKYLLVEEGSCKELRYHMFRNLPEHDQPLEECIEELDKRFRKAVDRIFSKNEEYGYQGQCDLSGGLDGRMITWVAHDLGYRNILNLCYSQSGTIDHTSSQKMAEDLGNEYYFLPMDGGDLLMDVDEMVDKFGGQVTYSICTGANRAVKDLASHNIGLSATGLMAGEYEATYAENTHIPPSDILFRYSKVVPYVLPEEYKTDYENNEQMNLYEEDNLLLMTSVAVRQQEWEAVSPYVDVEFLEFAYRIPLKWRTHRYAAEMWIVTQYPGAAKYVWQKTGKPVNKSFRNEFYFPKAVDDVRTMIYRCINKAARILNIPKQLIFQNEMNPVETWYRTNSRLREFYQRYYQENISRIQDPALRDDVRKTFEEGTAQDKIQAINILGIYKRYF